MLRILQTSSLIGLALLALLPEYAVSAETYDVQSLPRTLSVEQHEGKLHTQGYFPIASTNTVCKVELPPTKYSQEVIDYRIRISKLIVNSWDTSLKFHKTEPVAKITTNAKGELVKSQLLRSSNNAELDAKVLASINKAFPLPAAPMSEQTLNKELNFILSPKIVAISKSDSFHWNVDFMKKIDEDYNSTKMKWSDYIFPTIIRKIKYIHAYGEESNILVGIVFDTETGELLDHKIIQNSCIPSFNKAVEEAFQSIHTLPKPEKPYPMGIIKLVLEFKTKPMAYGH